MNSIAPRAMFLLPMIAILSIFVFGTVNASKTNMYCGLESPSAIEKRLCENETLFELDRKLMSLEAELTNGWHKYPYEEVD